MSLKSDVLKIVKVQNGTNGSNGVGISSTIITYGVSSSDTIEPSSYNPTFPSNVQQGQWVWTKTIINYTDSTSKITYSKTYIGQDGSQGQPGTPGVGISSTVIKYGKSNSENTEPSNWYDSTAQITPAPAQGDWLWVRTKINYTNGNLSTSDSKSYIGTDGQDGTSVSIQSTSKTGKTTTIIINNGDGTTQTLTIDDGEDGENGAPGANGYVHIAWANSADGSQDFSTSDSANKEYIGVYTDNTEQDSQHYQDYSWSLIKGADGADGKGIVSIVEYYARNNNKDSAPNTGWGTNILTPTVDQQYVWNYETINYSVGNPTNTDKHIVAMYGRGIQSIVDKYATSNSTTTPLDSSFNTTMPSDWGPNKKYLWNMETITYTDGNSSNSSKRIISIYAVDGTSITITGTSTSGGVTTVTFSDGTSIQISDGKEISTITEYYAISNNSTTAPSTGWSTTLQTPTSANPYLWNYEHIIYSDNTTTDTSKRIIGTFSKGITSITNYYAKTQNTTAPQSTSTDWVACPPGTIPTLDSTYKYLWNYERTVYNDSTSSDTTAHIISMYAKDGTSITVTETAYGTSNSSLTEPASWTIGSPTNIPNGVWLWIKTTFSDGSSIKSCSYSGNNGTNGYNSATVYLYQRKDGNAPAAPAGTLVYRFEDGSLTGNLGNWLTSLPDSDSNHYPCYVAIAAAISNTGTDEILSTDWTITKLVKDGTNGTNGTNGLDGYNQATIYLYKRSGTPITTAPSGMTYKFSNDTVYNIPTGWTRTIPASDSSHYPCYVTSASVLTRDPNASVNLTFVTPTKLVEDGQDGKDANQYQIHLNYQSLIKFTELNGNTLYIDSPLEITAWDTKNNQQLTFTSSNPTITIKIDNYNLSELFKATFLNTFLTRDNNKYILNLQTLYNSYSTWGSTAPSNVFNNNTQYSVYKQYFDNLFSDINGLSVGQIQIVLNSTTPSYRIERFIDLKSGVPDDLMKFTVSARSINAAVDGSYLLFNNQGLTITNGNFVIQNQAEGEDAEPLLSYDGNKLTVVGDIYANNGEFTGTVHAINGEFNGTVTAENGIIGGFNIGSNTISNGSLILTADGDNSSITVKNINIGTGANITDYLQIGNLKLLNPNTNNNYVMKLDDGSVKFSLDNNGSLVATNANISGVINASSGTFSGDIVAATISASTIKTLNFITNNVRSMGGSYIFKPTYEIINTTINGQNIIVTLNDANQFKSGDIVGLTTTSGIIYGSVYSKSNNDVTVSTAITGLNDTKFSTITWFGIPYNSNNQDSDVIIGINSDDSTSSILPKQSLVISDFTYNNTNSTLSSTIKLLLGKLSSAKDASGNELSGYGLYADNVYLHGSLVTETASTDSTTYAGVNTIPEVTDNIFSERIVFWAGATVANGAENSPFYVTENGSIYASRGRFTGSVIAESIISNSTIETAVIKGTGNSPSLKIYNTDDDNNYGISFYRDEYVINNTTYPEQETLRITNKGIIHYYKNNSIINNTPIISFAEDSENVNIKASSYQNGNTNYLNGLINYNTKSILTFDNNIKLAYDNNQYLNIASDNIELKNQTIISRGNVTFTNVYSNTDKKLDYKINNNGYYCLYVS